MDTTAENVPSGLGISDERSTVLSKKVRVAIIEADTVLKIMAMLAEHCETKEEVAFAYYALGRLIEEVERLENPLAKLFGR